MRVGVLLLVTLSTAGLSGCATVAEPVDMAMPDWQPGYSWSYAVQEAYDVTYDDDGDRGNESGEETYRIIREVVNTTQRLDGEELYITIDQLQGDDGGIYGSLGAFRQRDLAEVIAYVQSVSQCNGLDCSGYEVELVGYADEEFAPMYLQFPLQTGKVWSQDVGCDDDEGDEDEDGCFGVVFAGHVDGGARVDTPLGPIRAARVTLSYDMVDKEAYRDYVVKSAQEFGFEVDAYDFDFSHEEVVYYSEDYQAVVRVDVQDRQFEKVRGTDPDGEPFRFMVDSRSTHHAVLDGARLSARGERTLLDVVQSLDAPLRDPAGAAVAAAGYTLAVSPSELVVNAAETGNASFEAIVDGVDALPEGHTVHWRLLQEDGSVLQEAQGLTFTPELDRPGRFLVEVEAVAEDEVVTSAGGALMADWRESVTLECGDVSVLGLPGDCPVLQIPVFPGARSVVVQSHYQGALEAAHIGSMAILDNSGIRRSTTTSGDGHHFETDDPDNAYVNTEESWGVDISRSSAAAEEVTVDVEILYSDADSGTMDGGGMAAPHGGVSWHSPLLQRLQES